MERERASRTKKGWARARSVGAQVDEAEVLLLVAPEDAERADAVLAQAEAGEDALPDDAETAPDTPEDATR